MNRENRLGVGILLMVISICLVSLSVGYKYGYIEGSKYGKKIGMLLSVNVARIVAGKEPFKTYEELEQSYIPTPAK